MIRPECPFRVRCICCGFASGYQYFNTWEDADRWRREIWPFTLARHIRTGIIEANTDE